MLSRIIIVLLVLAFFCFKEQIQTVIGLVLFACMSGVLGCFINWIVFGELFCGSAFNIGFNVGLIVLGMLSGIIFLLKEGCLCKIIGILALLASGYSVICWTVNGDPLSWIVRFA